MYIEELAIDRYYRAFKSWEILPDEEKYMEPEPEKPQVLLDREYEEWLNQPMAPDIMELME